MTKPLLASLAVILTLSACGRVADSRLNPFNWFGRDRAETIEVQPEAATNDGRQFVEQVTELAVDATPGGAIIRAVGVPPTQGFWDAELVRIQTPDPANVVYEFRVVPPLQRRAQGTVASREIIAGASLSNIALQGVRTITVRGLRNQRTVRR
ncbi:hypothetical protein [uncultured Litoreibacter sp.]|uniref:hypothetical protein n=1 Tax=uncultured Litoreibacter sp. TaxID=1392394 RepID=UPI00260A6D52|nr:hypothetical protein [uncultured Litoreibacter sp.]